METEFDKLTTTLTQRGINLLDYFEYLEVASPEFDKLTTTLTQRGVPLEKYQKYLSTLKKAEFISLTAKLQDKGIDLEKYRDYLKQSVALQKITKSTQSAIKLTQSTHPTIASVPSTASFESESLETQELKKIGLKLLGDFEMNLQELNQTLLELPQNKMNSRTLLQTLLRKRKIRVEDFLELDQGKWTQTRELSYKFRLTQGRPEFYSDDQRGKIYGQYQVIQELARGGVGIVFKAIHLETNQLAALKVLIAGEDASENALNRFHREISAASKLKHPGIIQVLDSGQEGGQHYFVMEFVEGKTLDKLLKEEIAIREGLQIIKQALEALHYAHTHKIIHRDIKPDNIFVTKDGSPKIGDFGLARDQALGADAHQLTHTGAIMGTPKYMSPEQAMGDVKKVDARSDIYSTGVCLYQLLTLKYPYEANSLHQLLDQITHAEILPPSKHNPNLPKDLDSITLKALEKNPDKRYRTAKAFAVDIGRFLEGNTVRAKSISRTEICLKWVKRNHQVLAFTSFIFLLSLAFVSYFQWSRRKEQHKRFDTIYASALQYQKKAEDITIEGTEEKGQKIKHLLDALITLNEALSIKPSHKQTEALKSNVGGQLVNLACELEEYQLANYVASELQSLKTLSPEECRFFMEKVETARTQLLKEHLQQFEGWIKKIKTTSVDPQEQEEAVFEMSQMREEAIFSQLLQFLDAGVYYFSGKEPQTSILDEFYGIIVNVLGRQENKKACLPLVQALQKMSAVVSKKPLGQRPLGQLNFMIRIMQALGRLKDLQYLSEIAQVRNEMSESDLFCRRTYDLYQKMVILSSQETPSLTQHSQNAQAFFTSGEAKRQQKNFVEAISDFNEALKLDPNYVAAYVHRGWTRYDMGTADEEALQDFDLALRLDPKCDGAYNLRGVIYYRREDLNAALREFTQAIHLNPNSTDYYQSRGTTKKFLKDYPGAFEDLSKSIQLNPQNEESYVMRALARQEQRDYDGAILDLNEAVQINPTNARNYNNRGHAKMEKGLFPAAIQDLTLAIQYQPQSYLSYHHRGICYYRLTQFDNALQDLNQSIAICPEHVESYNMRGIIRIDRKEWSEALKDFDESIRRRPTSSEFYNNRAVVKYSQNDINGALQDYETARKLQPNDPALLFNLALAYYQVGKLDQAIECLEAKMKLGLTPEDVSQFLEVIWKRAEQRLQKNQKNEAKQDLLRFQKMAPSDHPKLKEVQQLLMQLDKK